MGLVALAVILRPGARDTEEVSYQDQSAWMVSRASGEIVRVNGAASDVASRIPMAERGARLELVPVGDGAAVLNRDLGELALIDGVGLEVVTTVAVDDSADAQLVSNGEGAYLITRTEVQPITAEPLDVAEAIDLDAPVTSPVVGSDGTLWAIERREGVVRAFDAQGATDRFEEDFAPQTSGLAAADGRTLVVDLETAEVTAVGGGPEPRGCEDELPGGVPVLGYSPTTTASQDSFVTVSDADRGSVVVWDVAQSQCSTIDIADAGADLGSAVVEGTTGYVPDYST
ncbi:MAG: hypothetical protein OES57_18585, partial [Acidimicrobiia bacterium]|nr:hypothetical protein [Acidimicrobiia bacterium]